VPLALPTTKSRGKPAAARTRDTRDREEKHRYDDRSRARFDAVVPHADKQNLTVSGNLRPRDRRLPPSIEHLVRPQLLNGGLTPVPPRIPAQLTRAQSPRVSNLADVPRIVYRQPTVVSADTRLDTLLVMPANSSGTHGVHPPLSSRSRLRADAPPPRSHIVASNPSQSIVQIPALRPSPAHVLYTDRHDDIISFGTPPRRIQVKEQGAACPHEKSSSSTESGPSRVSSRMSSPVSDRGGAERARRLHRASIQRARASRSHRARASQERCGERRTRDRGSILLRFDRPALSSRLQRALQAAQSCMGVHAGLHTRGADVAPVHRLRTPR